MNLRQTGRDVALVVLWAAIALLAVLVVFAGHLAWQLISLN